MGMSLSCYSSNHSRPPPDILYSKLEMGKRNRFSLKDNTRFNPSAGELKLLRWIWRELKQINQGLVTARLFEIIFTACPEVKHFFGLANVVNEKALLDERMRMHMLIMQVGDDWSINRSAERPPTSVLLLIFKFAVNPKVNNECYQPFFAGYCRADYKFTWRR
ncbi:Globin family protein [Trichuris trichiura]|uniref:Globin family protein n=1 Tax=Trichuris trichiura TaxID=36087 RepID=A0A077YXL5_TRITR|nr:Globin family protein [Trichuris trichiura]